MVTRQAEHGLLDCSDLAGTVMGLFGLLSRVGPYLPLNIKKTTKDIFRKELNPEFVCFLRFTLKLNFFYHTRSDEGSASMLIVIYV